MTRMHLRTAIFGSSRRTAIGVMLMTSMRYYVAVPPII